MFFKPKTAGQLIKHGEKQFRKAGLVFGHGTGLTPYDDASFLVLEALGQFEVQLDYVPTNDECAKIFNLFEQRVSTRKPSAYLVNKAYLQGLPFYVDERVIVPRSFIAELLNREGGFSPPGFPREIKNILDLCTGSGCLAILAALIYDEAKVDAVELSPDAFAVARRNVKEHALEDCVTLYNGDLFAPVAGQKYDLIITNPPYVDQAGMDTLPPEYAHEPSMALGECGADGLDIVRRIMDEAKTHLTPDGALLCEIGRGRANVEKAWPDKPFLWLETEHSEGEVFFIRAKDL